MSRRYEFVVSFDLEDESPVSDNESARQLRDVLEEAGAKDVWVSWEKRKLDFHKVRANQLVRTTEDESK